MGIFYQYLSDNIRFDSEFVFPDPEPPIINFLYGWSGFFFQLGLCSFTFSSVNNHFMYRIDFLLYLISSFLRIRSSLVPPYVAIELIDYIFTLISSILCIISLLVPYAYVSLELIDSILVSLWTVNAAFLTSSTNTIWFLLLNLYCESNINLLFLYELIMTFFQTIYL